MIVVNKYNNINKMISLRSKIAVKVLGYFFLNSESEKYINQLAKILALDPGNLARKLGELEKEGIISSRRQGNQRHYSLNKKYPLLREVKKIFDADFGLPRRVQNKIEHLKGLERAYIFGSFPKGVAGENSDIDLLLVGSHSALEAKKNLLPLEKEIGREINVVDMGKKEFERAQAGGDPFLKNIFSDKIIELAV